MAACVPAETPIFRPSRWPSRWYRPPGPLTPSMTTQNTRSANAWNSAHAAAQTSASGMTRSAGATRTATPTAGMTSWPSARPRAYQGTALRRVCTNDANGTASRNTARLGSAVRMPTSRLLAPSRTSRTATKAYAASTAPKNSASCWLATQLCVRSGVPSVGCTKMENRRGRAGGAPVSREGSVTRAGRWASRTPSVAGASLALWAG